MPSYSTMTKHELARRLKRQAGMSGLKRDGLKRRRKSWLAKMHRRQIAAALLRKERANGV